MAGQVTEGVLPNNSSAASTSQRTVSSSAASVYRRFAEANVVEGTVTPDGVRPLVTRGVAFELFS